MVLVADYPELEEPLPTDESDEEDARELVIAEGTLGARRSPLLRKAAWLTCAIAALVAVVGLAPRWRGDTGTQSLSAASSLAESEADNACLDEEVSYLPLDLLGTVATEEADIVDCFKRCEKTDGCAYYTYFYATAMCHVTGETASKSALPAPGVDAGRLCKGGLDKLLEELGRRSLPELLDECIEEEVSYSPDLSAPSVEDTKEDCRARCEGQEACGQWTYYEGIKTCHTSGSGATAMAQGPWTISAKRACEAEVEQKYKARKERRAARNIVHKGQGQGP